MTLIQVNPLASDLGFPGWSREDVVISVTPWRGRSAAVRVEDRINLILPDTDTLEVKNGVFSKPFDLDPTNAYWCWRITVEARRLKISVVRYVMVPEVAEGSSVAWSDLLDVDPVSLTTSKLPDPAWVVELSMLRNRIEQIELTGAGDTALALSEHVNSLNPHPEFFGVMPNLTDQVQAGLVNFDPSDLDQDQSIPNLAELVQNGLS